jgi:hypothetical protein
MKKRDTSLVPIGLAALGGAITAWVAAGIAREVMLAPLLILHAPTTLVLLVRRSSSWGLAALLGGAFYATYAALCCGARSRSTRFLAALAILAFNLLSMFALNLAVPWFGG